MWRSLLEVLVEREKYHTAPSPASRGSETNKPCPEAVMAKIWPKPAYGGVLDLGGGWYCTSLAGTPSKPKPSAVKGMCLLLRTKVHTPAAVDTFLFVGKVETAAVSPLAASTT